MNHRTGFSSKAHVPTIVCGNFATVPLGVDFDALIAAMQVYVDEHVAPVWGTHARLVKGHDVKPGEWAMAFVDHADHAHSLARHDLTPDGYPLARVFVKTTLADGNLVSVAATHELVEMLVDPAINLVTVRKHSKDVYQYEAADPVEDLHFPVNGIEVTNFVYPTWFEEFHAEGSTRFDHMGVLTRPFQIHGMGYQGVLRDGKWIAIHGSDVKRKQFEQQDRRGRRMAQRNQPALIRSR
ncbi:MAG: hypothetical protein JSR18_03740 [Proteobacteria bacterium]|nr:hypothetical protein [Pseudomonadota bacterium]